MDHPNSIMKKLTYILIIHVFLFSFIFSQSIPNIKQLKKQYEEFMKNQDNINLNLDNDIEGKIEGDLPNTEELDLRYYDSFKSIYKEDRGPLFFGYDFFENIDTLKIWNNLPVPVSYQLGPGDEVIISLWGETQLRESYIISRDGMIYIEKVGQFSLIGKSIEQAKKYLEEQFQKVYETLKGSRPSTFIDVSLGKLKSINVTFIGEVKIPGVHPIHPFSTALTGLIQVGGVDTTGSLRNIQIIRSNNDIYKVDFYKFLLSGKIGNTNLRLQESDVVFIPPRLSRIELKGAFKRAGIYEAIESDNTADIIDYAGGLRSNAEQTILIYKDIVEGDDRLMNKTNLSYISYYDANNYDVKGLKKIMVYKKPTFNKTVYIYGQVKNPGIYGFEEGMNMLDLIKIVGGLFDDTFYKTIYAPRADIIRRDPKSNYPKVIPINLEELKQGNQTQNIKLHNWDIIFVRKNKNFTIPKQVQITGEVNVPGFYTLTKPRENLEEILSRSGGFTNRAFKDGIQLYRDTAQVALDNFNFSLADGDSIHVPDYPGVVQVIGEVYNPGYVQYRKRRKLINYIEAAGGFTLNARTKYITIIEANGNVIVKDSFLAPRIKEGSLIIIHKQREQQPFDVTSFFRDAASIAASLTTIIYIIKQQSN